MANLSNFTLDSRFPMEKAIIFMEGSTTAGSEYAAEIKIADNPIGKKFYAQAIISFDHWQTYEYYWEPMTTDTELGIYGIFTPGLHFDWRLWGFPFDTYPDPTAIAKTSEQSTDKFILTTSGEYYRIYTTIETTLRNEQPATIYHHLGYTPVIKLWFEHEWSGHGTALVNRTGVSNGFIDIDADDEKAIITLHSDDPLLTTIKCHTRIYANESD